MPISVPGVLFCVYMELGHRMVNREIGHERVSGSLYREIDTALSWMIRIDVYCVDIVISYSHDSQFGLTFESDDFDNTLLILPVKRRLAIWRKLT